MLLSEMEIIWLFGPTYANQLGSHIPQDFPFLIVLNWGPTMDLSRGTIET